MPRLTRVCAALLVVILLVAGGCAAVWHPAIAPAQPADRSLFSAGQIIRGGQLVAIGDCAVCHTAEGGQPFAGGRGVATPFGTVYATNITPDPQTGIGTWTEAAFTRAMRDGIDQHGRHLYPVLPYPHFTRASSADIAAMYAYLMTRAAVVQTAPANTLMFPMGNRFLLAGWNALYLRPGPLQHDPSHDAMWNRGAYLVEAIGHCGGCHTPRNALGAEQKGKSLGGGEAENWYAPPLQAESPAAQPWTVDGLTTYLRNGFEAGHGAAAGPMTAVTDALGTVPESDIRAMAVYIVSLMPNTGSALVTVSPGALGGKPAEDPLFAGACGGCHGADAPMTRDGAPGLGLSTALNAATPLGAIQIILNGIPWREGKAAPYMPAFGAALTDAQIVGLVEYLRAAYTDKPAWNDVSSQVTRSRGAS